MKNSFKPVPRKEDLVVQELNGEVLIYDLGKNKAFCLNETSALVWQACNGEKNVSEISVELSKKLDAPANEDLVWLAIDQLKEEKLITNGEQINQIFEGVSRRDVIKKVGLGTMIALPIVTGLIAPTAASAQSVVCNTAGAANAVDGESCPSNCAGARCAVDPLTGTPTGTCVATTGPDSVCTV